MLGATEARRPFYHPTYKVAVTRVVNPAVAARIMGTGLVCKGIHLPPDPSPQSLPPDLRRFWDSVVRNANSYYNDEKLSQVTAWKTVRMFYGKNWLGQWKPEPMLRPAARPQAQVGHPGDLAELGVLVEYTFIDARAQLQVRRFPREDAPYCYWSPQFRSCYVFPGAEPGACMTPDQWSTAGRTFKTWTQRDAKCEREIDIPEVAVALDGMCDTIVYASDKWHDPDPTLKKRESGEYIHQVGDGVGTWQAAGKVPPAICVTGGCFDLEARGLIH